MANQPAAQSSLAELTTLRGMVNFADGYRASRAGMNPGAYADGNMSDDKERMAHISGWLAGQRVTKACPNADCHPRYWADMLMGELYGLAIAANSALCIQSAEFFAAYLANDVPAEWKSTADAIDVIAGHVAQHQLVTARAIETAAAGCHQEAA